MAVDPGVFVSYSRPIEGYQDRFLRLLLQFLADSGTARVVTLGLESESAADPLTAIKDAISHSTGLLAVAFRRNLIGLGTQRTVLPNGEIRMRQLKDEWLTSSYCHIEVAMAFQQGLPLLILQEEGVVPEGVLDRGSTGSCIEFFAEDDLPVDLDGLKSSDLGERIGGWLSGQLRPTQMT